jgi:phytoene synthase
MELYDKSCFECSKLITNNYSTSFSLGIKAFDSELHLPIYGIYGFVRFADEIADTFHHIDKQKHLADFKTQTYQAIDEKISLNPILQSFQLVVNKYGIEKEIIEPFFRSMEMDLDIKDFHQKLYDEYVYGSAEVIGLMCLRVFCNGDNKAYQEMLPFARKLGSAFQKINFLRDLKSDFEDRGRSYFPGIDINSFNEIEKKKLEQEIEEEFYDGEKGLAMLPKSAQLGVTIAWSYYFELLKSIKKVEATKLINERIRVPDNKKYILYATSYIKQRLN